MILADVLLKIDEIIGAEGRASLRASATKTVVMAAARKLGVTFPASLRALYEWHDGEKATSTLFHDVLRADIEDQWSAFSETPFAIHFLTLDEVIQTGVTDLWIHPELGATRSAPDDDEDAEKTVAVPFVLIRAVTNEDAKAKSSRGVSDDDWLLAVDAAGGAVWLYEVGDQRLEGFFEDAPNLTTWLHSIALKMQQKRKVAAGATPAPAPPSVLCLRFLLDRNLIELAEGVAVEDAAKELVPLLALQPPKRAVREVLEHLAEDDAIAEVFGQDDLLGKVIIEFVD